jgi:hypothetical protein
MDENKETHLRIPTGSVPYLEVETQQGEES